MLDLNRPKISVFLEIRSFRGKPETVTKFLGIDPDEAWAKHEVIQETPADVKYYKGKRPRRQRYSGWVIKASMKDYSYDVEDYIKNIIKRISPVRNKIKKIPGANVMLCIWIDLAEGGSVPSITLDVDTMRFLTDIGAQVDCDLSLFAQRGEVGP